MFESSQGRSMRDRIQIFKLEFSEFNFLSDEYVRELINIYDSNKEIAYTPSNISISMIGGFIVWSAGLLFCASAGK